MIFSPRLTEMARACDRLRFTDALASGQYNDMLSELDEMFKEVGEGGYASYESDKERMAQALETLPAVMLVMTNEFRLLLADEMAPYGGLSTDHDGIVVPREIREAFDAAFSCERGVIQEELDSLINSGAKVAYWESGWAGRPLFTVLEFHAPIHPSAIEVWWGAAQLYAAPSYLQATSDTAWKVIHVER